MEKFIKYQEDHRGQIQRNLANFKKSPKSRITQSYIETRLEILNDIWSEVKVTHKQIIDIATQESKFNCDYFSINMYELIEEEYTAYKCELKDYLLKVKSVNLSEKSESSTIAKNGGYPIPIKLPDIKLPVFSGKYTEWPTFRDLFVSVIHNNKQLDNVQKLHYLKTNLSGEAEQLLRHISITDANYITCWSQLQERYNNKRFLANCILKRLFSQNNLTTQSANGIKNLLDTTKDSLNALSNIGICTDSWDVLLIYLVCQKLDCDTRKQWEIKSNELTDDLPTFSQFEEFLISRFRALEFLEPTTSKFKSNNYNQPKAYHISSTSSTVCPFCSENHKMFQCKKFHHADYKTRTDFVQKQKLCFNCFGSNHSVKSCFLRTSCRICNRKHHTLLHPQKPNRSIASAVPVNHAVESMHFSDDQPQTDQPLNMVTNCYSSKDKYTQVLLATALVRVQTKNGSYQLLRALLDQGSQASFITESAVQLLGVKKTFVKSSVCGLGGNVSALTSKAVVNIAISSIHDTETVIGLGAHVLSRLTSFLPIKPIVMNNWPELKNLKLADPNYHTPGKIDILLGSDVYGKIIEEGLLRSPYGTTIAQKTNLGWVLSGQVISPTTHSIFVNLHTQMSDDELLKKFWELEAEPTDKINQRLTPEEQKCEELFATTTKRDCKGRYIVRLPFTKETPASKYGNLREIAVRRFYGQEKRLIRNRDLKKQYDDTIEEYLQLGHMEQIKFNKNTEAVYLPHHAVIREDKATTKVRVVFDASCKGENGISLNDDLMIGPRLQPDLRHLIMKFRLGPICLVADIVKMYRMVKVAQQDVDYQRLVWRRNPEDELKDYRLLRVTFGTSAAPYLAVKALQQLALDEGTQFPFAAKRVLEDFYVDDLMTTCDTSNEAIFLYKELNNLMMRGGFKLQKWSSNSKVVMKILSKNEKSKESMEMITDHITKVLGLTWNRSTDKFVYSVHLEEQIIPITKRRVISDISKLYDPLGWISPCIIPAKILIQKLWMSGISWDEELPSSLKKEWEEYRKSLKNLSEIEIKRWIGLQSTNSKLELHGFSDASNAAYAAVVYTRVLDKDGQTYVNLFTSKTKVAPIKQISIPRLELCGATLLTKLLKEVATMLHVEPSNIHAWTDSTIVLAWLRGHPSRWKTFVANRVSDILTTLESNQWSHVKSGENPADIASRGMTPSDLQNNILWMNGPSWLCNNIVHYDKPDVGTNLEERNIKAYCINVNETFQSLCERFSRLKRMIRVIAYCRRFLHFKKSKEPRPQFTYLLTCEELKVALITCIKQCQQQEFAEDILYFNKMKVMPKKSKLYSLTPFVDEDGLLRVRGRIDNSNVSDEVKHPIIIPRSGHFTKLMVADAHEKTLHGGPQMMTSFLRGKYWIIGIKNLVKEQYRKCVICARFRASTHEQFMGQLPTVRISVNRPFFVSGVDYAGPIQIRTTKGRGHHSHKGYVCVFVCMATRAVHLEVVSDFTAQGFLAAFKRFVARRGHCGQVWSDNGTNFVGASKELKTLFSKENSNLMPVISESLSNNGTSWQFIPPHAPHFGGLWEAGIKSTKYHLKRVVGNSSLTFEELTTVLCQIEACLNSRPIARQSVDDPESEIPLTPGHFLVGGPLVIPPDYNFEMSTISTLKRWQLTQRMVQDFWRRWSSEYLTQLNQRYKWAKVSPEPNIGDIVLVKEDNLPPAKWLYGRIEAKHPGPDNITRVVTIRCKNNLIKRAISKLLILPIAD